MQFIRYEFAVPRPEDRVPRMSRAGPRRGSVRPHQRQPGRVVQMTRRRVAALRAYRAGVLAAWTAFGEGGQDR
jgi:hypothetical protein